MIAVNNLVQEAYEAINMTGLGESTDGTMAQVGCQQLNRLISTLNSEGYIAQMQKFLDTTSAMEITFRKLNEGETAPAHSIDMEPPEKIDGVARKIGDRYLPLSSIDSVQMSRKNPLSLPTSWNYGRDVEPLPEEFATLDNEKREIGVLRLDGRTCSPLRIWYSSKMPVYTLDDRIYLSDLYNELLMSGLKYRLAQFYELSDSKKQDCYSDFLAAKSLIKRNNITQRMMRSGQTAGGYNDAFYNGLAPTQW